MSDIVKKSVPYGEIVAENISPEDFLAQYGGLHYEWVEGYVIKMSPGRLVHMYFTHYFFSLLNLYFRYTSLGQVLADPAKMQLTNSFRVPDVFVVLKDNPATLTDTGIKGVADICIELVSPESIDRDYAEKLREYEQVGVQEYWIIDPMRHNALFYRFHSTGNFIAIPVEATSYYETPLLPKFKLHIATLWQARMPDAEDVTNMVKAMLQD